MHVQHDRDGVTVFQRGVQVLRYQRATKTLDGKSPRADYVHPLYDLEGREVITEDFPADHLHHRGLFWAWHQVLVGDQAIGDAWLCKDFVWDVTDVETRSTDQFARIDAKVIWKSPDWTDAKGMMLPIVRSHTAITVHASQRDYRLIDFELSLLAATGDVRIGGSDDEKGYGGFSPRIKLDPATQFQSVGGKVQPQKLALDAGHWMNVTHPEFGLAVLSHAANPTPQKRWILRQKRSMQNAVYPGREPVPLSMNEPTILRYRLVIHRGDLEREVIDDLQREYEQQASR